MICACRDVNALKEIQMDIEKIIQDQSEDIDKIGEFPLWTMACVISMMLR